MKDKKSSVGVLASGSAEWLLSRTKKSALFLKTGANVDQMIDENKGSIYGIYVDIERIKLLGKNNEMSLRGYLKCEEKPIFQTMRLGKHLIFGEASVKHRLKNKKIFRYGANTTVVYYQGTVDGRLTPSQTMELPYKDDHIQPSLFTEYGRSYNNTLPWQWSVKPSVSYYSYTERRATRTDGSIRDPDEYEDLEKERSIRYSLSSKTSVTLAEIHKITLSPSYIRNVDTVFGGENFTSLSISVNYLLSLNKINVTATLSATNQDYDEKRSDPTLPLDSSVLKISTTTSSLKGTYELTETAKAYAKVESEVMKSSLDFDSYEYLRFVIGSEMKL